MIYEGVCPFCFHKIRISYKLWYLCLGRGNGTCQRGVDPIRQQLTKSMMETYPAFPPPPKSYERPTDCPACGGKTGVFACPDCHTPLPAGFGESQSPLYGIVGTKGAGKTTLMTVLVRQLRDSIGKRFDSSILLVNDNPDGQGSLDEYHLNREIPLYEHGRLPVPTSALGTATRQQAVPVQFRWQQQAGRKKIKSSMFSVIDTAGEDLNNFMSTISLPYLPVADGLIVLLDPFALPSARATLNLPRAAVTVGEDMPLQVLGNITDMLRTERGVSSKKQIKLSVAVVFTKMDAFFRLLDPASPLMTTAPAVPAYTEADGLSVHEHMLAMLHQWNAQEIDAHMRLNFTSYRYFGVSALGAEPDYERSQVAPGGIRPHRLEDPVLWLLSQSGKVKTA